MALISCADCAKEVSDKAVTCPHCGAPSATTEKSDDQESAVRFKWWLWLPLALIGLFFAFPYLAHTPAERAAISARADCERVFPAERGRGCERVYGDTLLGNPTK